MADRDGIRGFYDPEHGKDSAGSDKRANERGASRRKGLGISKEEENEQRAKGRESRRSFYESSDRRGNMLGNARSRNDSDSLTSKLASSAGRDSGRKNQTKNARLEALIKKAGK